MNWIKASEVEIDTGADYLVKTNGGEWRDVDLKLIRGWQLKHLMRPNVVRGTPIWVALVTDPMKLETAVSGV